MTPPNSRARAQNYLSRYFPFNGSNPSPGCFVQSKAWRWNRVKNGTYAWSLGLDLAFLGVFLSGTFEWSFCGFGGVDGGLSHIVCFGRRRRI
jgi:hypothetical protein